MRTTIYAAVFPSAYFFGVVYSEALFLLTLVGAALAFRTKHWKLAALAAAAMTATRVNGVMFLPALLWLGWRAAGSSSRDRAWAAGATAAGLVGIGAYSWFNYQISGNPFEWYDSITRWGYHPGGNPLSGLLAIGRAMATRPMQFLISERMAPYDTLNALTAAAALCAVPFIWRRYGFGYAAVVLLGLLLPLSSGQYRRPRPVLLGAVPVADPAGRLERRGAASWNNRELRTVLRARPRAFR